MTSSPPKRQDGPARLILVVEDEVFVALDFVATLEEAGYRVLGPAPSVAAALKLLSQERPDAAVLDVSLRDGMVTPVARLLRVMDVPFVVASAYGRAALPDDEVLTSAEYLGKPTAPARLLAAMQDLHGRGDWGGDG